MDMNLVQAIIDVIFKGNLVFLAPFLFLLMIILFSDRLIELMYNSLGNGGSGRRGRY